MIDGLMNSALLLPLVAILVPIITISSLSGYASTVINPAYKKIYSKPECSWLINPT
jgi:hypothetical protein